MQTLQRRSMTEQLRLKMHALMRKWQLAARTISRWACIAAGKGFGVHENMLGLQQVVPVLDKSIGDAQRADVHAGV